jgi:hypothetical protein
MHLAVVLVSRLASVLILDPKPRQSIAAAGGATKFLGAAWF